MRPSPVAGRRAGWGAVHGARRRAVRGAGRGGGWAPPRRPPAGGYTRARPADQIFLGDVFRTVDGPLAEVRGLRPHETAYTGAAEHLPVVWVAVRASLRRVLDETSLADVLDGNLPAYVEELAAAPDAWRNR